MPRSRKEEVLKIEAAVYAFAVNFIKYNFNKMEHGLLLGT
jgi:hypothetical protein